MDDAATDLLILTTLAERGNGLTTRQIVLLTVQYQSPVPERDVASRLQHLKKRSCVMQRPKDPQTWYITLAGTRWMGQNRKKK